MAGKSDYAETLTLNLLGGRSTLGSAITPYVALYTAAPTDAGGGTEVSTGSWTNYARKAVTFGAPTGTNPTSMASNAIADFGTATTTGDISVVAWGLFDASTAGNLLYWNTFGSTQTVQNGNPVSFQSGALTLTED